MKTAKWAIDFDGTVVESFHGLRPVGPERKGAVRVLRRMSLAGHVLILWTCRYGSLLKEAVDWCKEAGIEFDLICENAPLTLAGYGDPRKVVADFYLDDKGVPPFMGWDAFEKWLEENGYLEQTSVQQKEGSS